MLWYHTIYVNIWYSISYGQTIRRTGFLVWRRTITASDMENYLSRLYRTVSQEIVRGMLDSVSFKLGCTDFRNPIKSQWWELNHGDKDKTYTLLALTWTTVKKGRFCCLGDRWWGHIFIASSIQSEMTAWSCMEGPWRKKFAGPWDTLRCTWCHRWYHFIPFNTI